jgi:hypothetical protein
VIGSSQSPLPDNTQLQQETNIQAFGRVFLLFDCFLFVLCPYLFLCLDCPGFCLLSLLQNTHDINIQAPGGIRIRNSSKREALDCSATGICRYHTTRCRNSVDQSLYSISTVDNIICIYALLNVHATYCYRLHRPILEIGSLTNAWKEQGKYRGRAFERGTRRGGGGCGVYILSSENVRANL